MEGRLENKIAILSDKIETVLDIREKELPFIDLKLSMTNKRMNNLSRYLVRQKYEKSRKNTYRRAFQALIDNREANKYEKGKVKRCLNVLRKYVLYHAFRRYAKNINLEAVLKDKSKIDGAYLLIKRFKNRLKGLDEVVRRVNSEKANRIDLERLEKVTARGRAEVVFEDMTQLFESTVK